jgi:Xaa-Pro dipeptidase
MNERMKRLQERLIKEGADGALFAPSANLQYLLDDNSYWWQRTMYTGGLPMFVPEDVSGHFLNMPDCLLYLPASGEPTLFATYERAKDMQQIEMNKEIDFFCRLPEIMPEYIHKGTVAVGESCSRYIKDMLKEINPEIATVDAEVFVEEMRCIKDEKEIETMRRVAAFTDEAMGKITKILRPGISSYQVQKYMADLAVESGLTDIPFPTTARFVKTDAPESADIDGHPMHRPMQPGTSIGFDFGYVMDGYCSDFGRSFYCGEAPADIADGYKALIEAQMTTLDMIKPGIPMDFTFSTMYKVMEKRGYEKYLRKYGDFGLMGHQIGIDVHERPWVHSDQKEVFKPGMIMCIEPKFWWPGRCFMRVEDMVLITETGCEPLTKYSREEFSLPLD